MPPRAAPAAAAPAQGDAGEPPAAGGGLFSGSTLKLIALFFLIQMALQPGGPVFKALGLSKPEATVKDAAGVVVPGPASATQSAAAVKAVQASPLWPMGTPFSVSVFLSTDNQIETRHPRLPSHRWTDLTLGEWGWSRIWDTEITVPASVQRNGTLFADFFLVRDGARLESSDPSEVVHVRKLLTRYLPEKRARVERNLLTAADGPVEPVVEKPLAIVSHWYSNLTMVLLSEPSIVPYSQFQPPMQQHVQLTADAPDELGRRRYLPIVSANEFWHLSSHLTPINETVSTLPLRIELQPISMTKWQLFTTMTDAFEKSAAQNGGGGELDEIKRALIETSPWLLITTAIVSVLHMLFEMLAFTGDVKHWRNKKDNVGVSVRTILTNIFMQARRRPHLVVILLYLKQTSYMILLTQGMGIAVEAYKITKTVDVRLVTEGRTIPRIEFQDKHVLSEDEKKTQEYDALAFRLVGYVLGPSLLAYAAYSLRYSTHRSWYSFVISTLTSAVYGAGFATLIPQLIINYKLKSVAHIPMKGALLPIAIALTLAAMMYKFVIRMPWLHRLACFRDDAVFLVLLYQKWIYRVDYTRQNEFGQHFDEAPEKTDENAATRALETRKDR